MPSVRGRQRRTVAMIVTVAGTATGALVGLLSAVLLAPFGEFSTAVTLLIIAVGLALDGLYLAIGRPRPPASGRQVPQEWGRLFDARIVALLYGARLGVGPLTILSTWTWWSVTVAAALVGPPTAVVVGATFGLVRLLVTVGVSALSSSAPADVQPEHHALLFRRLRARQRSNWIALNGVGLAALLAVVLTGCGGGGDEETAAAEADRSTTSTIPAERSAARTSAAESAAARSNATRSMTAQSATESSRSMAETDSNSETDSSGTDSVSETNSSKTDHQTIITVQLEDFVRPAGPDRINDDPATTTEAVGATQSAGRSTGVLSAAGPSSEPQALADALLATIDGFDLVDAPGANRFLNLAAAADIQPDPTEEVALLETRGFEGGWTRAFRNASNDVAVASVYQFEDAGEAEFYLEDGLITIGGYGGKFFDIEGLPGVRGFVQYFTETDAAGTEELVSLGAAFQTGPRWYLVYFVGSTETITPEVLIPAITAQRQSI